MTTERYAVLGDPIKHSRSPAMHNAAFAACRIDARYERLRIPAGTAARSLRELHHAGYSGLNITVPLKVEVLDALRDDSASRLDALAMDIGAVNTLVRESSGWRGMNTDAEGFVRSLPAIEEHRALVLGAGGAARAVIVGLVQAGWTVEVSARRENAAESLVPLGATTRPWLPSIDVPLVVNATSASLHDGEAFAAQFRWRLPSAAHIVDLVYGDALPFLQSAKAEGATVQDGSAMLVHQGAIAFEAWTGVNAPIDVMVRACANAF